MHKTSSITVPYSSNFELSGVQPDLRKLAPPYAASLNLYRSLDGSFSLIPPLNHSNWAIVVSKYLFHGFLRKCVLFCCFRISALW